MGNGDMGKALSPSPALLAYMIRRPIAVDEYLLWSVAQLTGKNPCECERKVTPWPPGAGIFHGSIG